MSKTAINICDKVFVYLPKSKTVGSYGMFDFIRNCVL